MTHAEPSTLLDVVRRDIASMRTRGAGEIGKQAVAALANAAQGFSGTDLAAFRAQLLEAARRLASARPTAVSLRNGLNTLLTPAMEASDVPAAQAAAQAAAEDFSRRVDAARAKVADLGQAALRDGDVVLTHCHSSVAVAVITQAVKAGKRLTVYATETRPFRQGLITTRKLAEAGVASTLIVDSAAYHVMKEQGVTHVVVGADTVAADGSLYNKIGTSQVALAAKALGIPFTVAAETYKFSPYTLDGQPVVIEERDTREVAGQDEVARGVKIHNPVFDRTPPDHVRTYLTEEGPVEPNDTRAFVRRTFGGIKQWI